MTAGCPDPFLLQAHRANAQRSAPAQWWMRVAEDSRSSLLKIGTSANSSQNPYSPTAKIKMQLRVGIQKVVEKNIISLSVSLKGS